MLHLYLILSAASAILAAPNAHQAYAQTTSTAIPTVTVKNGTYTGVYSPTYNEDLFLGIPFAKPPVQDLRYRNPQPLDTTWNGTTSATEYAPMCIGYGSDDIGYPEDEDCLYLNVVRPSGYDDASLPVAVWIHGGGFRQGGTRDHRYNTSFIVENSVKIGKPIMAVSIAYRLGVWGFLNSDEVFGTGQTNLGLKDQRLALHWIQENIAAFGGDPTKVTIWGQSAGSESIGFHIRAFNGRDDSVFRAAIMESGPVIPHNPLNTTDTYQPRYDALVQATNCTNFTSTLDCIRKVPFTALNNILNTTEFNSGWNPSLDGDFVARYASEQLRDGDFVHIPIIVGATSDEGTNFSPDGVNTTADFVSYLNTTSSDQWALPEHVIEALLKAYPDDPSFGIPSSEELGGNVTFLAPYGAEYRRSAAYWGDEVFIAGRRWTCEAWSKANLTAYSYRFNTIPNGNDWETGATHFSEVAFVFNNLQGLGYAVDPFLGKPESYTELSYLMSNSWASFVHDIDPNDWNGLGRNATQNDWPRYDHRNPQNMVWDANVTSYAEADTWRAEGIKLINENALSYHR